MKTLALLVWLLVGLVDVEANEGIIGHTRSNVEATHHSGLESNNPFCQNVVAYYEGTLKNKFNSNLNYTVQFQVRLNANQSDQQIYVVFDHWNQILTPTKSFSFDFAYGNKDIIGNKIGTTYSGPFGFSPSDFTLTLDHGKDQKWDNSIHVMYFNVFNNSFQLENTVGQCTKKQLESTNVWNMDPTLINYCVCCGDYLPSEELGCPVNPWSGPVQPTTPPPLAPVSCQSVVAYYNGTFKNKYDSVMPSAQFQFRMTSNQTVKQYQLTLEGWDQTVSKSSDFAMYFYYYTGSKWCYNLTVNETCTHYFGDSNAKFFDFNLYHGERPDYDNKFHLFYIDPFYHTFTFDAIGKCTDSPPNLDDIYTPDPTLYQACLCCDDYNPHPSLNCPKNPWV